MPRSANTKRLTEQMVEKIRPPTAGRLEFGDEICPGLLLRVTERGVRSFSVIYKVVGEGGVSKTGRLLKGKQHRITLGQWPALKLPEARKQAREIIGAALEGQDYREVQRSDNLQRGANTLDRVFERFMKLHAKPNVKSWQNIERVMLLHVLPHWGDRPIRDIRRSDIHQLIDHIVADGKVGTAREVRKHLSSLFNWAVDRELVLDNPVYRMTRADLKNNHDAGRSLSDEELQAIWQAAGGLGYPFGTMYQLLILTGQRRNEWANAKDVEIDREKKWLEVPRIRYKGGRDHIVPLSDAAYSILEVVPQWGQPDSHLFSTTGGIRPVSGFSRAKSRLDRAAEQILRDASDNSSISLKRYRVHDFRVTCETRLANLGFAQEVRDAVLGHAKAGLQKVYNKYDYLEEKRAALHAYSNHITGVVK